MNIARPLLLSAIALISACGGELELPPAKPLATPESRLQRIPGINRGTHEVVAGEEVEWTVGERRLRARAVHPKGDGPFPLVVFSHGFASDIDQYDAVLAHWASHGFATVMPYHLDGGGMPRGIFNSIRHGNLGLVAARVADVQFILDNLDRLDALSPGLAARIDRQQVAIAGHSFGAFTAQQFGGAVAIDPESGERAEARYNPRVRAIVAISPPAEMFDVINKESWKAMDAPMLATTGTWDMDGRFVTDWQQKKLSFETAKPGKNWLLVVEGADHYFGNLICRLDRDKAPQTDQLRMLNAATTTFLKAYLENRRPDWVATAHRLAETTSGYARITAR